MSAINTVTLSGNLVREPELRYAPSGMQILNNAIAVEVQDKREDSGRKTHFFNFTVFGNYAEKVLAPKLKKGDPISISGELRQRIWETNEGEKRYEVEVIVRDVFGEFQYRKNGEVSAPAEATTSEEATPEVAENDDIPF